MEISFRIKSVVLMKINRISRFPYSYLLNYGEYEGKGKAWSIVIKHMGLLPDT